VRPTNLLAVQVALGQVGEGTHINVTGVCLACVAGGNSGECLVVLIATEFVRVRFNFRINVRVSPRAYETISYKLVVLCSNFYLVLVKVQSL
jgi:hypothetical protein